MTISIDSNAAKQEASVLVILPALVTLVLKLANDAQLFGGPYLNTIVIMIALGYQGGIYFGRNSRSGGGQSGGGNAIWTHLAVDVAVVAATIMIGKKNFLLNGPPVPGNVESCYTTYLATVCIVATVKGFHATMSIIQNFCN